MVVRMICHFKNIMKYTIIILLIALTACLHRGDKIEYEQGVVIGRRFTPGYMHTYITYERVYYGRSYKGRQQSISVPRTHQIYVPAVYTVVFKCQHQSVFEIHRDDIYNSL